LVSSWPTKIHSAPFSRLFQRFRDTPIGARDIVDRGGQAVRLYVLPGQFMVKKRDNTCFSYDTVMAQQHTGNDNWSGFGIKEGNVNGEIFNSTWQQASCRCMDN
jgi:hypothetical protein